MYEATNPTFEKGISMSSLTVYAPQITILDNVVNMIDGLYSLNDMHKASGKADKHRPTFFLRNQETKDLITELTEETADVRKCTSGNSQVIRVVKGGNDRSLQGTYVCKELVYRYAMWISAKFALVVIRTFDALVTRTDAKQREALVTACDKLAIGNTLRSDVYTMVANHFGYEKVTQIPAPLLPEAVAFVYDVILAKQKGGSQDSKYVNDMHSIGTKKVEETRHAINVLQKALASLDCSIEVIRQNNETQAGVFESLKRQTGRIVK